MFTALEKLLGRHRDRVEGEQHPGYYVSLMDVEDREDGFSRQKEIRKCAVGEAVELVPAPDDEHGPNAVAVYRRKTNRRLGFLPREAADTFSERIRRGEPNSATVYDKLGGHNDGPTRGLRIRIEIR